MIRKSTKPLLLIPEEAMFGPLKNIVLAIDFNEMIGRAGMEAFSTLIKQFDASVSVWHVQKIDDDIKASEIGEKLQMGIVVAGFDFQYEPVEASNVDKGILAFIDRHPTDMLVMIAHHSAFERLFNPIHTSTISAEIKLPLLILKVQHL